MKKHNPQSLVTLIRSYYSFYYTQKRVCEKTRANHIIRTNQVFRYLVEIKKPQIEVQEIDLDFIKRFIEWSNQLYQQTNTARNIELIKRVINFAIDKRLIQSNIINSVVTTRTPIKEVINLEMPELDLIYNYQGEGLKKIAAVNYSFQAETGLSYGDLQSFEVVEESGVEWVHGTRVKGIYGKHKDYWIPLSERAKEILKKYNGKIPAISCKDYNEEIKAVGKELGIKKYREITTHTARKSFATRMYNKGYSRETISDMLANDISSLKHYIKESNKRTLNEYLKIHR